MSNNRTSLRVKRKADEKKYAVILQNTKFDIPTLQRLELHFQRCQAQHANVQSLREKSQKEDDAIEAIGFRDFCIGFDSVIQDGEPEHKCELLIKSYAQEENEISRDDIMRMLKEHISSEFHDELSTGVYTWLKKKFRSSKTGSYDCMELNEALNTILQHPKMIYQKIDISIENLLNCMKENAKHDRVVINSLKHL